MNPDFAGLSEFFLAVQPFFESLYPGPFPPEVRNDLLLLNSLQCGFKGKLCEVSLK